MRAHATMLQVAIGDRVTFETDDGRTVVGALVRYNKKTVSVLTDDGHRWKVSPRFLRPLEPRDIAPSADAPSFKK
jgi:hypothetical protein